MRNRVNGATLEGVSMPQCYVPPHRREAANGGTNGGSGSGSARLQTYPPDDGSNYTRGDSNHGVTSLIGARKSMEDVCHCVTDLNERIPTEFPQKHSLYAIFDGHSGAQVMNVAVCLMVLLITVLLT